MILKGFKEKSIKKQLNLILKSPKPRFENLKVKHVGVILNVDENTSLDALKSIAQAINVRPNKMSLVAFSTLTKNTTYSWETCFNPKDFSWNGKIINTELQTFVNSNFDMLISYYTKDITELKYITAVSKAKFKVGIFQADERLNDLIIKTTLNQVDSFKAELHKYLKVLNKLNNE